MTRRIAVLPLAALLAAGLLTACEESSEDLAAGVQWADGVCSARSDLSEAVSALNDSLTFDPAQASSLDQAKTQVQDRVDAVRQAGADLKAAVADVPDGVDADVAAAQEDLTTEAADVTESVTAVGDALSTATSATSAGEFATALAAAGVAAAAAKNAVGEFADTVQGYGSSSSSALKDAFNEAPACREG
jgi:hypothetical protein